MIAIRTLRLIRQSALALIVLLVSCIAFIEFGRLEWQQHQRASSDEAAGVAAVRTAWRLAVRSAWSITRATLSPMLTFAVDACWYSSVTTTALKNVL
jgi:hypothetical protein